MTALPITAFAVLGRLSLRDCRGAVGLDLWPTRRSRRTGSTTSQWGSSGSWRRCAAGRRVRRAGLGHLIPARKLGSSKPSVAGTETAPAKGRMDVRAVVVKQHGGPEVLEVSDREAPHTGPGQLLVDVAAAGVNFMDIYHRQGTRPTPAICPTFRAPRAPAPWRPSDQVSPTSPRATELRGRACRAATPSR